MATETKEAMNAGNLDPDHKSEESSKTGTSKMKFRWILILVSIAVAVYAAWNLYGLKASDTDRTTAAAGQTAESKLRKALPDPQYGTIKINTKQARGFKVKKGWNLRAVPVGPKKLEYEFYVDEVLQSAPIFTDTREYWADWRLKQGQGIDEVDLAYVLYVGPEPDLLTWYRLATARGNTIH